MGYLAKLKKTRLESGLAVEPTDSKAQKLILGTAKDTNLTNITSLASPTQETLETNYELIQNEPQPEPKKQFRNIPFKFTARQLLSGEKTQTRRRPDKHNATWRAGETFNALGEHDEIIAHIKAQAVRKQRLGDITEDEAVAEGFKDLAAFRAEWIKYYRKFDEDLEVLVLEFEVLPEVEPLSPWPAKEIGPPVTLLDFRQHGCYPAVRQGELLLVTATGDPVTDAGIITAWEAAKDNIQAQLEARHAKLTAWAETLLKDCGRVYLFTPETVDPLSLTISSGFSGHKELAAEVLRSEALALWYEVTTNPDAKHPWPSQGPAWEAS